MSNIGYLFSDCLDFIVTLHKKSLTSETQVAVALAEHLFTKLTKSGYIIDSHGDSDDLVMCYCGCKTFLSNKKTDTSIGTVYNSTIEKGSELCLFKLFSVICYNMNETIVIVKMHTKKVNIYFY